MKKILSLALAAGMFLAVNSCMKLEKPDYDISGAPTIKTLPKQRMILAGARGTAGSISGDCISSLYSVYFSMKFKGKVMAAPRARWPIKPETPAGEWVGIFGVPVPEGTTTLPDLKKSTKVEVKLGYWEYGEIAEILHAGSYDSEMASVDKLKQYIKEKGYEISGIHEEVYLKGPGMFGKGDPKKYLTLIRYQVKKAASKPKNK